MQAIHVGPRINKRLAILVLLALVASLLVSALGAKPAMADSTLCSGNDWTTCPNAGYTDHGYGTNSNNMYWTMYSGHNCTNYVAYVEQTVNGAPTPSYNLGSAYQWASAASSHGVTVNGTPGLGSVAQWNANSGGAGASGHVAYVESVNGDGSITISEDNYSAGPFRWRTVSAGSGYWPSNFIHFKDMAAGYQSVTGDFNGDGYADLALRNISSGTIYIRFGSDFGAQITYDWAPGSNFQFLVGDFDHNGASDLVLRDTASGIFYIRYSSSTGFGNQTTFSWAPGVYFQSIAGDFNHDGYADLALRDTGSGIFYIRYGPGFGNQITFTWAPGTYFQTLAGDFNGDGYADLVLRDMGSGTFYIRYGPVFGSQTVFAWAPGVYFQSIAGDFNHDGYYDLALRDTSSGMFYIRYGQPFSGQTTYYWPAVG